MLPTHYKFRAKIWLYPGHAGWHFVTVPKKHSDVIKQSFATLKKGWGSLPVRVTIGSTSWKTSIFPDKKSVSYLLPVKADIRKKESLSEGDTVTCFIEITL